MSDKNTKNKILNSASHLGFKAQSSRDKLGLVSLEPRLLLDAAGFVTGAEVAVDAMETNDCLLYTSPSPRDRQKSRMPSSA